MASNNRCFNLLLFAIFTGLASSSFISDEALKSHGSTGRTLLQAKTSCSVDFENQNYTIITSQCKGPNYQAAACCSALKQFACPFTDQINDEKSDCASTMFSYINLYGKYPPALFSSLCREGKEGLSCNSTEAAAAATSSKNSVSKSGVPPLLNQSPMVMVSAALFVLLFKWF